MTTLDGVPRSLVAGSSTTQKIPENQQRQQPDIRITDPPHQRQSRLVRGETEEERGERECDSVK